MALDGLESGNGFMSALGMSATEYGEMRNRASKGYMWQVVCV